MPGAGCELTYLPRSSPAAAAARHPPPSSIRRSSSLAVWKAAAYGDFEKLRELSDAEPEALHRPDEQGFYALQWASLNNRVAVLTYLLDKGCDANAADGTGQTALHWSGVRGSTAAMETLLRGGADLEARDSRWVRGGASVGGAHAVLNAGGPPAAVGAPKELQALGHRTGACSSVAPASTSHSPTAARPSPDGSSPPAPHLLPPPAATLCATSPRSTARQPPCTTWRSAGTQVRRACHRQCWYT